MKYRKKPVDIEAVQFKDDSPETIIELQRFMDGELIVDYNDPGNPKVKIETLEGTMYGSIGDYIIKGVRGEFYPCKPDIFKNTYDMVKGEK